MKAISPLFLLILVACNALLPAPFAPTRVLGNAPPTSTPNLITDTAALLPEFQNDLRSLNRPTTYDLALRLDPPVRAVSGTLEVEFTNKQPRPLNEIYFRLFANEPNGARQIAVTNALLNGETVTHAFGVQNTALRVEIPKPLAPDQAARLHLDFSVTIPVSTSERYNEFSSGEGVFSMPTIYPLIPAQDADGWHLELPPAYGDVVNADTSVYRASVTAPATMTIIASGSTLETRANGDGTKTWLIVAAPARDFAFAASDRWQAISTNVGAVQVNSYFYEKDRADGEQVGKWAAKALEIYSERIGAYPYREFDLVETPNTAGGIEYPGMTVIGQNLYGNPQSHDSFQFVVAHETAHQWFYGIVGDDQVNHPWLDESLVQYCTLIYYQDAYGKEIADRIRSGYFQALYENAKKNDRDKPIGLPVPAYGQDQYSEIVYGKGPLFFDALREQMGDELFFKWLRAYFQRYKYKIVTPSDFLVTLNEVSGRDFTALYEEWVGK